MLLSPLLVLRQPEAAKFLLACPGERLSGSRGRSGKVSSRAQGWEGLAGGEARWIGGLAWKGRGRNMGICRGFPHVICAVPHETISHCAGATWNTRQAHRLSAKEQVQRFDAQKLNKFL